MHNTHALHRCAWQGGATALHFGALHGHVDLVQQLIAAGADVDQRDEDGAPPHTHTHAHTHARARARAEVCRGLATRLPCVLRRRAFPPPQ